MAIAIWIAQGLLGLLFIITGSFKFFQTKEKVVNSGGAWAADYSQGTIRIIAGLELISGILVIVPRLLGYGIYFTIAGAACIAVIMAGSIYVHMQRKEYSHAAINVCFLLLALFVAGSGVEMR